MSTTRRRLLVTLLLTTPFTRMSFQLGSSPPWPSKRGKRCSRCMRDPHNARRGAAKREASSKGGGRGGLASCSTHSSVLRRQVHERPCATRFCCKGTRRPLVLTLHVAPARLRASWPRSACPRSARHPQQVDAAVRKGSGVLKACGDKRDVETRCSPQGCPNALLACGVREVLAMDPR